MNVKQYFIIILFIIVIPGISAEECIIEYIEGILEIKEGSNWVEAEEGDEIPVTSILKTYDDTFVELSYGHNQYTITAKGIYSVESIIASRKDANSWDIVNVVEKKLAYIIKDEIEDNREAVLGVRGNSINLDEIDWMEHSDVIVWNGQVLIDEGKYNEALEHFQKALIESYEDEINEYLYYIGYCYAKLGEKTLALITLTKVNVDENEDYYGSFILLKARLLAESLSFQKALTLLDQYLKVDPNGKNAQAANFLSAYCYKNLNMRDEAKKRLTMTIKLGPDSPLGKEARKQLEVFNRED